MKHKGITAVIGAGVLWGLINIFIKKLSSAGLGSMQIAFVRLFVAAAIFTPVIAVRNPSELKIHVKDCWMFIGTGIISVSLFNYFYFYTIINGEASVAVILLYTSPIFVMAMAAILFKEKITGRKLLACTMTLIGCILTSGLYKENPNVNINTFTAGIVSGFLYALYTIFGRYALKKYSPGTVTVYTFLFALAGTFFMTDKNGLTETVFSSPQIIACAIGLGIISTVLPYFLYTYGLQHMESGKAAIYVAVEPAVGTILGMTVFGENISPGKLMGIAFTLLSIVIMNTEVKAKNSPDVSRETSG